MRLVKCFLLASVLLSGAAIAQNAVMMHQQLTQLAEDIVFTSARLFPTQATFLGITQYDAELEIPSESNRAAYIAQLQQWKKRLHAIASASAPDVSLVDRDDSKLLEAQLSRSLNALQIYQVDRKDYSIGANTIVNCIFLQLQFLPVTGRDGATPATVEKAWVDITSRLNKAPAYIAESQRLVTHPGHLYGIVGSEELGGASSFFNGALTDAAKAHYGEDSESLSRFLHARDATLAAIAKTKAYIDLRVAQWSENFAIGRQAYDRLLREEQLLPFDSRDIERMGNYELAHGWAEEAWLTALSQRQNMPFGPQTGGGLAPAGSALVDYYRERIAELTRFVIEHEVITLPTWLGTIVVQETPAFLQPISPGASMIAPRLFSQEVNGYYFITPPTSLEDAAARLDMNQDFDRDRIFSTVAHEVIPGHFLQLSVARRHSDFVRKIQQSSVFEEGWAFYGEEMFVRLGLYGSDLDARLFTARWERVRGARAIVDPKLASGEWSFRQAADYYARESGFTQKAADAAVAGIATNPGYVIAYTAGRLQLEQLLASYLQKTAGHGSLRDFHDRLLSYGSAPFAVVGPELLADLDKPASSVRAAANY
jgi:uncharacterized protein (DUF885 family)